MTLCESVMDNPSRIKRFVVVPPSSSGRAAAQGARRSLKTMPSLGVGRKGTEGRRGRHAAALLGDGEA